MKLSLILAAAIGAAFALLHSDNLTPNESLLPGTAPGIWALKLLYKSPGAQIDKKRSPVRI